MEEGEIGLEELAARLADESLTILDVRTEDEFTGRAGYACDPRQGHIPRARHLDVRELVGEDGSPRTAEEVRRLVGAPEGAEVAAYCHSGGRSAIAAAVLRATGYRARNFSGSWHEWSRRPELPSESGEG